MKAKDRYSAEGLMAHRQRVMTGPNAEAVKRKSENAKKIAAITRRLKQGTAREERPHFGPYFDMDFVAKSIRKQFDASTYASLLGAVKRPRVFSSMIFDDILVRP